MESAILGDVVIVVDEGAELRIVTQPDHAHFASELLGLWRTDELLSHPRREDLLLAVREHDNGWQEADSAPLVDRARGRPHDFSTYPTEARLDIWRRGIYRFARQRPFVALLIVLHAESLHGRQDPSWRHLFDDLEPDRQTWMRECGLAEVTLNADYRYLQLADTLSLAVCRRRIEAFECRGWRGKVRGDSLSLDPFPLAGDTTFQVACRRIPSRYYNRNSELAGELARARWQRFSVKVAPL